MKRVKFSGGGHQRLLVMQMARAYYPDGGTFKPFSAEMVGGVASYDVPMFNQSTLKLGSYSAANNNAGDGFTIISTITEGYNAGITQQLVSILTFRFSNGQGSPLYNGWQTSFPAYTFGLEYYYTVSGSIVDIYCKNNSFNGLNVSYVLIGRSENWQHLITGSDLPSNAVKFTPVYTNTSVDAPIVVSASQPNNPSATLWIVP